MLCTLSLVMNHQGQTMNLISVLHCLVIFLLLLLFGLFFGFPSLENYLRSDVYTDVGTIDEATIPLPAVTICVKNPENNFTGWKSTTKDDSSDPNTNIAQICRNVSPTDVFNCIEEKTFNLTESVMKCQLGITSESKDLLHSHIWSADLTVSENGLCHTLKSNERIGADPYKEVLYFILNDQLQYKILVHDPRFFYLTGNPSTIPQVMLEMKNNGKKTEMRFLRVTKHVKINRKEKPCNENESYSFTKCVMESLSQKVGCRLEWNLIDDSSLSTCSSMEQISKIEKLYLSLTMLQQSSIVNLTGCDVPCSFMEYSLVGDPFYRSNEFGLGINSATADILNL